MFLPALAPDCTGRGVEREDAHPTRSPGERPLGAAQGLGSGRAASSRCGQAAPDVLANSYSTNSYYIKSCYINSCYINSYIITSRRSSRNQLAALRANPEPTARGPTGTSTATLGRGMPGRRGGGKRVVPVTWGRAVWATFTLWSGACRAPPRVRVRSRGRRSHTPPLVPWPRGRRSASAAAPRAPAPRGRPPTAAAAALLVLCLTCGSRRVRDPCVCVCARACVRRTRPPHAAKRNVCQVTLHHVAWHGVTWSGVAVVALPGVAWRGLVRGTAWRGTNCPRRRARVRGRPWRRGTARVASAGVRPPRRVLSRPPDPRHHDGDGVPDVSGELEAVAPAHDLVAPEAGFRSVAYGQFS